MDTFNNEILAHSATSTKGSNKPYYHCLDQLKRLMDKREEQTSQVVFHTDQGAVYSSQAFYQAHSHYNILRSMSRVGTPTDNPIIEALNGWIKEELFLDFDLAHAKDVPALLDEYVVFFNNRRLSAVFVSFAFLSVYFCLTDAVLAHQISALIFNNTDVLILTLFCDLRLVSVYTVFRMITSNLEGFLGYTAGSVNFVLGQNFKMDRELYVRRLDTLENFYSALVYAVFSVALFLMLPFMRLYTAGISDANYVDGTLAVLFVVMTLLSQTRMPMQMAIEHSGHFKQTTGRTLLEAAINLIVSLLAVNRWGIYGVLVGTIAALLYRTNDILVYSNRKILQRSPWRSNKVYGLNIALFVGMTALYPRLFSGPIDSYWHFALVGAAATVLALVVFVGGQLLCFPLCRQQLKAMLGQTKGKLSGRKA